MIGTAICHGKIPDQGFSLVRQIPPSYIGSYQILRVHRKATEMYVVSANGTK